jgi:hypothetical protein
MISFSYNPTERMNDLVQTLLSRTPKKPHAPKSITDLQREEYNNAIPEIQELVSEHTSKSDDEKNKKIGRIASSICYPLGGFINLYDGWDIAKELIRDFINEELQLIEFMMLFPDVALKQPIPECYKQLLQSENSSSQQLYDYKNRVEQLENQLGYEEKFAQEIILLVQVQILRAPDEQGFDDVQSFADIAERYGKHCTNNLNVAEIIQNFGEEDLLSFKKMDKQTIRSNIKMFLQTLDQAKAVNLILPIYQGVNQGSLYEDGITITESSQLQSATNALTLRD